MTLHVPVCAAETNLWCRLLPMSLVTKACKYARLFCVAAIDQTCQKEAHEATELVGAGRFPYVVTWRSQLKMPGHRNLQHAQEPDVKLCTYTQCRV